MNVPRGTIFEVALQEMFVSNGIALTEAQVIQMRVFYDLLVDENAKYNLTAITDAREAAEKHFLDSVIPHKHIPRGATVLDVGSGAGFPIVPLTIVRKDISPTALEASVKKCAFIERACKAAGIYMAVCNGRAEELAHTELRETFDVCVTRAVSALPTVLELCIPYVVENGLFFAYKGKYVEELEAAKSAMKLLNVTLVDVVRGADISRECNVLVFQKHSQTDARYPRKNNQIMKRPL